jgi:hypothetical protein
LPEPKEEVMDDGGTGTGVVMYAGVVACFSVVLVSTFKKAITCL